jgi:hypothetical protein
MGDDFENKKRVGDLFRDVARLGEPAFAPIESPKLRIIEILPTFVKFNRSKSFFPEMTFNRKCCLPHLLRFSAKLGCSKTARTARIREARHGMGASS